MVGTVGVRQGFTLVELLTVIVIIAILMGILLPTIAHVQTRMQIAATATLLSQLEQACQMYAVDFGQMPPDGSFFYRAGGWQKIGEVIEDPTDEYFWALDTASSTVPVLDSAEALVFYLGSEFLQPQAYLARRNEILAAFPEVLTKLGVADINQLAANYPLGTPIPGSALSLRARKALALVHMADRNAGPYYAFKKKRLAHTDTDHNGPDPADPTKEGLNLLEVVDVFGQPIVYNDNNRRTNFDANVPASSMPQGAFMPTEVHGAMVVYPKDGARARNKGGVDMYSFGPNGVNNFGRNGSNNKDDDLDGAVDELSDPPDNALDEKVGDKDDINNY